MRDISFSFSSPDTSIQSVDNSYIQTQHSILASDLMKKRIVKVDDSNARGKYHTIDKNEWEEIESHIINSNLLGVGREHKFKDAVIFVQLGKEGRTDNCNNYLLFHKQDFIEYKKERGQKKYQDTAISGNGTVWVGNTETKELDESGEIINRQLIFRVFVPKRVMDHGNN